MAEHTFVCENCMDPVRHEKAKVFRCTGCGDNTVICEQCRQIFVQEQVLAKWLCTRCFREEVTEQFHRLLQH